MGHTEFLRGCVSLISGQKVELSCRIGRDLPRHSHITATILQLAVCNLEAIQHNYTAEFAKYINISHWCCKLETDKVIGLSSIYFQMFVEYFNSSFAKASVQLNVL